jgi:hypothetical protein
MLLPQRSDVARNLQTSRRNLSVISLFALSRVFLWHGQGIKYVIQGVFLTCAESNSPHALAAAPVNQMTPAYESTLKESL